MKAKGRFALLCLLYLLFFGTLAFTFHQLPERLATHFSGNGQADGWMSREAHIWFTLALAIGLPGLVVGLCYVLRFLPVDLLNLPHREYWIAPERRRSTYDFLFQHSIWFACLAVAFVLGIHLSILNANKAIPPQLSTAQLAIVAGGFLIGILIWALTLIKHFFKKPEPSGSLTTTATH